jgi:hypothetical protein
MPRGDRAVLATILPLIGRDAEKEWTIMDRYDAGASF